MVLERRGCTQVLGRTENYHGKRPSTSLFSEEQCKTNKGILYQGVDLCVPDSAVDPAAQTLVSSGLYEQVRPQRSAGREPFAPFPRLKRVGVNLYIVLIPSSFFDLRIPEDCVSSTDSSSGITMVASKPDRLVHAFLYAQNHHEFEAGQVNVEYLMLFNADDPEWGDDLLEELDDKQEQQQLQSVISRPLALLSSLQ